MVWGGGFEGSFPTLYTIAQDKQALMSNYLTWHNEEMVWLVILLRVLQDWEVADFTAFMEILYNIKIKWNEANHLRWNHTGRGIFEVRSFYHLICSGGTQNFPWKSVWQVKVPPKVAFFTWLAAHAKNLTIDNLHRRKIWVLDWCFMCKRAGESVDHLLLHCEYARELWSFIFCIVGMPCKVTELLACWGRRASSSKNVIWNAIPSCLMWLIWRESNRRAFEDSERHSTELKLILLHTILEWMAAMISQPSLSLLDFIDGCL